MYVRSISDSCLSIVRLFPVPNEIANLIHQKYR
jgi:hypothetical protein